MLVSKNNTQRAFTHHPKDSVTICFLAPEIGSFLEKDMMSFINHEHKLAFIPREVLQSIFIEPSQHALNKECPIIVVKVIWKRRFEKGPVSPV
jgi:hypothetical protein